MPLVLVMARAWGVLRLACFTVVTLRFSGIIARYYRDQHLLKMINVSVAALEQDSIPTFLDYSTLLGFWREGGFLEDEVMLFVFGKTSLPCPAHMDKHSRTRKTAILELL